jgi:MerR family transcriptional regulator, copper efflux regulator
MLIHELSKRTGLTTHTIRFYERSGLIRGRRDEQQARNNYFHYDEETVEKLEFIQDAKSVGFTISEIGQLLEAWYENRFTLEQKLAILDAKLLVLEQKAKEIRDMKKQIARFKSEVMKGEC